MFAKIKEKLATILVALDRGRYWMAYVNFLLILFVAVSDLKQYEALKFLQDIHIVLALFAIAFVLVIIVGYIDLKKGIYRKEAEVSAHMNPIQNKILRELQEIQKDVKELKKKL